jgi:hypothetical protein
MSWLKYGTIGAIIGAAAVVGAAFLFGDSEEAESRSFDEFEDEFENETPSNPEIVPES